MWIKVDALKIKVQSVCPTGIYARLYSVYKGKEIDMLPYDNDCFLSKGGTLTIASTKGFKMKQKVEIT
jgi:hypothetical protein